MEPFRIVKWRILAQAYERQGGDIYTRPLEGPELLLVDALDSEAVKNMEKQGFAPAVTVETRPGGFQAWVKLSDLPLTKELCEHAISGLVQVLPKFGRYGRLAGFTNQRVERNREVWQPYVLTHVATGKVALAAQPYLNAVEQQLREYASEKLRRRDTTTTRVKPNARGFAR